MACSRSSHFRTFVCTRPDLARIAAVLTPHSWRKFQHFPAFSTATRPQPLPQSKFNGEGLAFDMVRRWRSMRLSERPKTMLTTTQRFPRCESNKPHADREHLGPWIQKMRSWDLLTPAFDIRASVKRYGPRLRQVLSLGSRLWKKRPEDSRRRHCSAAQLRSIERKWHELCP